MQINEDIESDLTIKKAKVNHANAYTYDKFTQDEFDKLFFDGQVDEAIALYEETGIGIPKYISFIDKKGNTINFDKACNKSKLLFLELHTDNGNLILSMDDSHKISDNIDWQVKYKNRYWLADAECIFKDMTQYPYGSISSDEFNELVKNSGNGYETCDEIIKIVSANRNKYGNVNAVRYCHKLRMNLNNVKYYGYLGSLNDMNTIRKHLDILNYAFEKFGKKPLDFSISYWTCNECSNDLAFIYPVAGVYVRPKEFKLHALPLFKRIK